jgi:transketolase
LLQTSRRSVGRMAEARYVGTNGHCIGMETFGASAPLAELQKKFGFTPADIVAAARRQIAEGGEPSASL